MIDFEKFKKYMEEYKDLLKKEEDLNNALEAFSLDFGGFYLDGVHEIFPKMLADLTNDTGEWIEYFIYELEWGKEWNENSITDENGNSVKLQTIEDLYKLLESEYENEKKENEKKI